MAIPLIIDTDIGDDIDDALALALALRSREVQLVGVTTVYQCAGLRARMAAHLLTAYGRGDVPVVVGVDRPLVGAVRPDWTPNQAAVLHAVAEPRVADGGAVDFIIREGMRREGLVVLPIGAMTNVALAFALEPRLVGRVRVVAMAGAWDRSDPEYNVQCDPEAVAIVLAAGVHVDFVGLDVTTQVVLRTADLNRLAATPPDTAERTLLAFMRAWQRGWGQSESFCPVMHDPLAVAAVFRPELLGWKDTCVAVELGSPHVRGLTSSVRGNANARIARSVDAEAFLDLFGRRVCAGVPDNE